MVMRCSWRTLNRRYEAVREMQRGTASSVYVTRDLEESERLTALKVFQLDTANGSGDGAWTNAQREFAALRRVDDPHVAEVYSLGRVKSVEPPHSDTNAPPGAPFRNLPRVNDAFLAFQYIDGLNLREAFLRLFTARADFESSAKWNVFYGAVAQIFRGLASIHTHNLVHHDIKPENILLVPNMNDVGSEREDASSPATFDARIIDFGFAREKTTPLGRKIKGTVPYIAPEILTGSFADGRSDLYSVGISLVFAISARFPFPVDSPDSWVKALRESERLTVEPLLDGIPKDLVRLIEDLTHPDVEQRIESAAKALERVEELGDGTPQQSPIARRRRIPTIGWERQLEVLRSEFEALELGENAHSLVVVEIDEGNYVDRFVEEVEILARLAECTPFVGAFRNPTRLPYDGLSGALTQLVHGLDLSHPSLRRFQPMLSTLVPSLSEESGSPTYDQSLSTQERFLEFVSSLRDFLAHSARTTPIVIVIEDLHLAEEDSLEILERLTAPPPEEEPSQNGPIDPEDFSAPVHTKTTPANRVLFIAIHSAGAKTTATRDDESSEYPLEFASRLDSIRQAPCTLSLQVGRLATDQAADWLKQRYPGIEFSPKTVQQIVGVTTGSPRLIDELATAFDTSRLRDGISAHASDGLDFGSFLLTHSSKDALPPTAADKASTFCARRLEDLDTTEQYVLELFAVSHSSLTASSIEALARLEVQENTDDIEPIIERLRDRSLLRSVPGPDGVEFGWTSEALRESMYGAISPERRRTLHARLLDLVQAPTRTPGPEGSSEEAAFHALRAGKIRLYLECSIAAAESWRKAFAHRTAAHLLEQAFERLGVFQASKDLPADTLEDTRKRILLLLGQIYRDLGDYPRAIEKLTVSLSLSEGKDAITERASLCRLTGEVYQDKGDRVNAQYFLEKGLELLENRPPCREHISALLSLSSFLVKRGQLEKSEALALRAFDQVGTTAGQEFRSEILLQLGSISHKLADYERALSYNSKALDAARDSGDLPRALKAFEALGTTFMARTEHDKAVEYLTRGIELATLLSSKRTLAKIYNHLGKIHYTQSSQVLALDNFNRSRRLFDEINDRRGVANSHNNIGLALCLKDDLAGAAASYRNAIEMFSLIGDEYGQATGMNNLAEILELEGSYHEALEYAFRSLKKRKAFSAKSGIAHSYHRIGSIYKAKGELDKALSYSDKALQLRREIGDKLGLAYSTLQLSELALRRGRLGEALIRCEEVEREFEVLENRSGSVLTQATKARILLQVGDLDTAIGLLEGVLAWSRQNDQQRLSGRAVLDLARAAIASGDLSHASQRLEQAETSFHHSRKPRDLADLHLMQCRVALESGQHQRASSTLERAYDVLEQRGIRDLVPVYFLLRGRFELEESPQDPTHAKKFLERAIVEAREMSLPESHWQIEFYSGLLETSAGERRRAFEHFLRAESILSSQAEGLDENQRELFWQGHTARIHLRTVLSSAKKSIRIASATVDEDVDPSPPSSQGERHLADKLKRLESVTQRAHRLQEITKAINCERNREKLLEKVLDAVLDLMDGEHGFLIVKVTGTDTRDYISASRSLDDEQSGEPESEVSRSIAEEVIQTGEPLLATNAIVDDRFSSSKSVRDLKLRSVLCVPLKSRDDVLGAIYVDNRHRRSAFTEDDLRLAEAFSDQATTAIINARLAAELSDKNVRLARVNAELEVVNNKLREEIRKRTNELEVTREHMRERLNTYESHLRFDNLIGKSNAMQSIFKVLKQVAPTGLPVLVEGESGTGKELIARAIHTNSERKRHVFVSENCAALSEPLLESELFGHTRGAFTGATSSRKGLFEQADGGTLFLDEVGEMSLAMQKKLLRVLQEGEFRKVGGKDTVKVDIRLVCASNQRLVQLVESGRFREDLYYRVNGIRIDLPPLRDRREDIPLLVHHFLDEIASESKLPRKHVSEDALRTLTQHSWPGNVRELKHFLERMMLVAEGSTVEAEHCIFDNAPNPPETKVRGFWPSFRDFPLREARDEFVRLYVERCFDENDSNVTRAAKACGMSRESFHRFLKKYKIARRN